QQCHRALSSVGANADNGALTRGHGRQLFYRLTQDARACCAEGMAERDAASVRVQPFARKGAERGGHTGLVADEFLAFQRLDVRKHLRGKSLVDFPEMDIRIAERISLQ